MSKIVTVTLNPSLDRTVVGHHFNVGYANRASEPIRLDPAGRGVNVSRALARLGVATNAVVLLGDDAVSLAYQALVRAESLPFTPIVRAGHTRSNTIVYDTAHKHETQYIEESSVGTEADIQAIIETLRGLLEPGDEVIFAGDLTLDGPRDTYARLLKPARDAGASITLYTSGEPLRAALLSAPDRVILRQRELETQLNYPVRVVEDCVGGARALIQKGARQVLVMMLRDTSRAGAVLIEADSHQYYTAPIGETGTSSGVEDALVAGFLGGLVMGRTPEDALRLALAAADYTSARMGNQFGALDEISPLLDTVASPGSVPL